MSFLRGAPPPNKNPGSAPAKFWSGHKLRIGKITVGLNKKWAPRPPLDFSASFPGMLTSQLHQKLSNLDHIIFLQGFDSTVNTILFYALELHVIPPNVPCTGSRYRVFTHHGDLGGLSVCSK